MFRLPKYLFILRVKDGETGRIYIKMKRKFWTPEIFLSRLPISGVRNKKKKKKCIYIEWISFLFGRDVKVRGYVPLTVNNKHQRRRAQRKHN